MLIESFTFSVAAVVIILGLIGTFVPLLPGTFIVWLAIFGYALVEGFAALNVGWFILISLIAITTGTSDFWMPLVGGKVGGASRWSLVSGVAGGTIGFFIGLFFGGIGSLPGAIIGYIVGIMLGEYRRLGDWNQAFKAAVGAAAGYGVGTALQFLGSAAMAAIFFWQVLDFVG